MFDPCSCSTKALKSILDVCEAASYQLGVYIISRYQRTRVSKPPLFGVELTDEQHLLPWYGAM